MLGSTRTELTSSAQEADFSLTDAIDAHAHSTAARQSRRRSHSRVSKGQSRRLCVGYLLLDRQRLSIQRTVTKIAERRAALGKSPVYLYYFRWETPVDGGRLKSPHTIEIPFAFDNVKAATRLTGGGPEAMALADKVATPGSRLRRPAIRISEDAALDGHPTATDRRRWSSTRTARGERSIKEQRLMIWKALGYDS
jgi:carboxylesterase type B